MTTAIAHRSPEGTLPSRRRLTYEEVIDYIARDPDKIKYPNRQAKFLRNPFELSFRDTLHFEQLQEQQLRAQKFQVGKLAIQKAAVDKGTSASAESTLSILQTPMPVPAAPPLNQLPLSFGRGALKLASAAVRGVVGVGLDLLKTAYEPPEYYTYDVPPPEEDSSVGTMLFGSLDQHIARQQAMTDSLRYGISSSSSSGAEPEPRVTPPGETEVARQMDMKLLERVQVEKQPGAQSSQMGRESLKKVEAQNNSIVPYVPLVRAMASMLMPQ